MLEQLLAGLIGAIATLGGIYYMNRSMKSFVLEIVDQIATTVEEKISSPIVKQGMTLLGKKSGDARASKAVMNKFNANIGNLLPAVGVISERLGMDASEMLSLWNDPMIGPVIQGFIGGMNNQSSGDVQDRNNSGQIPMMSGG